MSIREVFPENLKFLMRDYSNIAKFSREIRIERTKLNRYLSGQSSPQPEELKKLCDFFDVSADILFYPINEESSPIGQSILVGAELKKQVSLKDFSVSALLLPSGLYQLWRHSVAKPGYLFSRMVRVHRRGQVAFTRLVDSWDAYGFSPEFKPRHSREVTGVLLGQPMGFFEICFGKAAPLLSMTYYHHGYKSNQNIYPGYYITSQAADKVISAGQEFLEYLGTDTKRILTAARQSGYHEFYDAPKQVQELLNQKPFN